MAEEGAVRPVKYNAQTMVDILASFNIKVTQQDLKQQSVEKIIEIHKVFLKTCLNVDESMIETITFETISTFTEEVISYQKNAFKRLQFFSLIYALFEIASIDGHIPEIFFPHTQGKGLFIKQLSTLVNFARFEYMQLEDFSSIQLEYKAKSYEVAEIQTKNSWYRSQIATLKQDKNEKRIPIENTKKRIGSLTENINKSKANRSRLEEEIAKYEKELANTTAEKEETLNRINTNQKRAQFLDKMLIKSPEKLRKDIDKNKIKINETDKLLQLKKEENDRLSKIYAEREKFIDGFELVMETLNGFYDNDMTASNKVMKEIEIDKEERINKDYEVEQLESKIKIQVMDKDKKQKEYEAHREMVEKEMLALNTKDQIYQAQIEKIEARIRNAEKAMNDLKADQKSSIEIFQNYMAKESVAVEYIQKQRESLESKRRIFEEIHNQMRVSYMKRGEKFLVGLTAEEEGLNELLKIMQI